MEIKDQNVLVTGGAGFIGSHLTDALVERNCQVTVLDNLSTGNQANLSHLGDSIRFVRGDIRDPERVDELVGGCELIFHQAAVVSVPQTVEEPMESARVNAIGTLNLLEAARKHKVKRMVLASSCAVYGDDPEMPNHEGRVPKPLSPYAVQKRTGELYAAIYPKLYGLETVCLRYFNVFGPRQDPSSPYSGVISIFMTQAAQRRAPIIHGDGNQTRDFIFVQDVVRANLLAAQSSQAVGGAFNIGTGRFVRINDLWKMIAMMSDLDLKPQYGPPRAGDIRESFADIAQAKSKLGFGPEYSFEKGLQATLDWYRESNK
jgi:UDP-glucose 4-epimerase